MVTPVTCKSCANSNLVWQYLLLDIRISNRYRCAEASRRCKPLYVPSRCLFSGRGANRMANPGWFGERNPTHRRANSGFAGVHERIDPRRRGGNTRNGNEQPAQRSGAYVREGNQPLATRLVFTVVRTTGQKCPRTTE